MKYLFGPEIFWLILLGIIRVIAKRNIAPAYPFDKFLENLYLLVPFAVLLTFALWHIPLVEKSWLLLRVWITCLILGHLTMDKGMAAFSEQGPGIGTAYIIGMLLVFFTLIIGSVYVWIRF